MGQLTFLLFISLFVFSSLMAYSTYRQSKYLTCLFCLSFSLKVLLFFFLESGLKYTFVLDSLKYEQDAWNLMKAEVSNTKYILEAFERAEYLNPFTTIMLNVFYIFGKIPQMVTLLNMFLSLGIYFFCIKIAIIFLDGVQDVQKNKSVLALSLILFFYPSLNIWSVTNTKDPAALFFLTCGLYLLIHIKKYYTSSKNFFHFGLLLIAAGSIYVSQLFRPYILPVLGAGLVLGGFMYLIKKKMNLLTALGILTGLAIAALFVLEHTQPELFKEISQNIYKARAGFLNEDWIDDQSKSAFLVNYAFNTTLDYISFVPQALAYYFFGPFAWEVSSLTESLGLFEVLFIVFLIKPFVRGLQILDRKNSFEFNALLSTMILLSVSQAFIISNMGTIFRHRTLSILIYLIISTGGFRFATKKLQNS